MSAPWPQELLPPVDARDWFTPIEVAAMVGIGRGAIQKWVHEGFVPGDKVNGMLRVAKAPFLAWYATMPPGRYKRPKTRPAAITLADIDERQLSLSPSAA